MILFINGPFGVGKTSVAKALVGELPRAVLYDPEVVGAVLQKCLRPFEKVDDFQDYTLWRELVVGGARLMRKVTRRTLVIPMTVYRRDIFDAMVAGFRLVDPDLSCFKLTASRDVLMHRISSDIEDRKAYAWRASHVEVCTEALLDPAFGAEIRTEDRTPVEIASRISKQLAMPAGWSRN